MWNGVQAYLVRVLDHLAHIASCNAKCDYFVQHDLMMPRGGTEVALLSQYLARLRLVLRPDTVPPSSNQIKSIQTVIHLGR